MNNAGQIYALSATLTMTFFERNSYKSSTYSYCDITVGWDWTQCPFFTQEDIIALAWSEGMYCDTSSSNNSAYIYWGDVSTNSIVSGNYTNMVSVINTGLYVKKDLKPLGGDGSIYLRGGVLNIRVHKQASVNEIAFLAKYGHNELGFSPSVEISATGPSLGISFSWFLNELAVQDLYVDL
jgi:hypothetical protein